MIQIMNPEHDSRTSQAVPMPSSKLFVKWGEPLSLWMVNRRTMPQIPRYPYQEIWTDFVEFSQCRRCYY